MTSLQRREFIRLAGVGALGAAVRGLPFGAAAQSAAAGAKAGAKPNIVIILSDDQGYADVSHNPHHPKEVHTPHIDALMGSGVRLSNGYVSGHVCSPTRAGLMTGNYQQRVGIYTAGEGGSGMPLDQKLFPQYLKPAGYVSAAFGKWHLGLTPEYNAVNRGFDEFYGFMGRGGHDYFKLDDPESPIYRGLEPIKDKGYLTTRITEEACSFITRHKNQPFFAYVAYNAVHYPQQAPAEDIAAVKSGDPNRDVLMAMLKHLDLGVGRIVETLKQAGVFDNTLIFYLSDNGGAKNMSASNAPLRGWKAEDYEGGVHVPFFVTWPARLQAGTTCDVPIVSFDILPTALAAAGVTPDRPFDGVNMLPALEGKTKKLHDYLCWSSGGAEAKWAILKDDWKLVGVRDKVELFNIREDLSETTDLAAQQPERVKELRKVFDAWLDQMADPVSGVPKRWNPGEPAVVRKNKAEKQAAKKTAREAERAAGKGGGEGEDE